MSSFTSTVICSQWKIDTWCSGWHGERACECIYCHCLVQREEIFTIKFLFYSFLFDLHLTRKRLAEIKNLFSNSVLAETSSSTFTDTKYHTQNKMYTSQLPPGFKTSYIKQNLQTGASASKSFKIFLKTSNQHSSQSYCRSFQLEEAARCYILSCLIIVSCSHDLILPLLDKLHK